MAELGAPAGGAEAGIGGTAMSAVDIAAPGGDTAFLEAPATSETLDAGSADTQVADGAKAEETASPEIDLSALEEGQPEWLAKVTDPAVKTEIEKLLADQAKFSDKFKDAADLEEFFKELPGGREQVAALQTLSKEVASLDAAIEANTPEGNLEVAERYLSMAPDGGAGLLRAAAQHMAKASPETWNQIATELINSSLSAKGIGSDFNGLVNTIGEVRAAIQANDEAAFGKAVQKLLGEPKQEQQIDPALAKASERENAARAEAHKAQTESWQYRSEKSGDRINNHIATETGKALAKVLPASIPESDRASLRSEIATEVLSQLYSNAWLASKATDLIGLSTKGDKGTDYSKANVKASQQDWDKATQMMMETASSKMIAAATARVVTKWSRERASTNADARSKARSGAVRKDVGAAPAKGATGRRIMTEEMLRGPKALTDEEILNY